MNSTLTHNINHRWYVQAINDGTMKQVHLYDYYVLGKALEPLFQVKSETLVNDAGFDAVAAYKQLKQVIREDSVFLPGTRRVEAFSLLGIAYSAITQVMKATESQPYAAKALN